MSNELYEEEIRAEFQSDFDDEGPGDDEGSNDSISSEYSDNKKDHDYELEDIIALEEYDYLMTRAYEN